MSSSAPDWPGLMKRPTAARYCDMKIAEFEREVAAGHLPGPVILAGEERWPRRAIDEALERLAGSSTPDWRAGSNLYASR